MAIIFVRSLIVYVFLLVIMRFMGKRQIGEMQPFELVITLLISELACIPMSDVSIPLLYGMAAVVAVFIIHQIIAIIEKSGSFFKDFVSGKPSVVINKNGVDFKELKRNNLDVSDLIESMRGLGYFSLDAVDYAIYESNGTLSAIQSQNSKQNSLSILIIKNGKFLLKNLKLLNMSQQSFKEDVLEKIKIPLKKIEVFTIDGQGNYYVQAVNEKFKTGSVSLPKGVQW